jgi:hypothetical protein
MGPAEQGPGRTYPRYAGVRHGKCRWSPLGSASPSTLCARLDVSGNSRWEQDLHIINASRRESPISSIPLRAIPLISKMS